MSGVLSIDVFDTCLVRTTPDPQAIWIELAGSLRRSGLPVPSESAFEALRARGEAAARAKSSAEDISLWDIYREIGGTLGWSTVQVDQAVDGELELEASSARPNRVTLEWLRKRPEDRIVFVSDTPLPGTFLRTLLDGCGFPNGSVYTSGDVGLLKAGGLFPYVCTSLGISPGAVTHAGNDPATDGYGAAKNGLAFVHLGEANPNRYERALADSTSRRFGLLGSRLAGAARLARLASPPTKLSAVAHCVAGPVLLSAVAWALGQAFQDGVDTLYFAARDGELPLRIAQLIQSQNGELSRVKCRYLYGSRSAWQSPPGPELLGYLEQEGLLSGERCAVVDLGWYGQAAGGLLEAVRQGGGASPTFYFLGGLCGPRDVMRGQDAKTFLFDARGGRLADQAALVHLMESFCQGGEGTTVGYQKDAGRWVPILGAEVNGPALEWGLCDFQDSVLAFVQVALTVVAPADWAQAPLITPQLMSLLTMLWNRPGRSEAEAWAGCPFDNPEGTSVQVLARAPSLSSLGRALVEPRRVGRPLEIGPWTQAGAALCGLPVGLPSMASRSLRGAAARWRRGRGLWAVARSKERTPSMSKPQPPSPGRPAGDSRAMTQPLVAPEEAQFGIAHVALTKFVASPFVPPHWRTRLLRWRGSDVDPTARLGPGFRCSFPHSITAGPEVFVNSDCVIDGYGRVSLGARSYTAPGVRFLTTGHRIGPSHWRAAELTHGDISVGAGVWIGARVLILPGVSIGPGAVIGAGSVVTRNVPPDCLYAGTPARLVRELPVDGREPGEPT
ncbi:MAG: DapH/DapD/GlmU-related protein [Acidimicrobiales bacterium]